MTWPDVVGICPACGWRTLMLADGGHVTCRRQTCPDPEAAGRMLDRKADTQALRRLGRALAEAQDALGHLEQPAPHEPSGPRRTTHAMVTRDY
jgi:hypothetical protein